MCTCTKFSARNWNRIYFSPVIRPKPNIPLRISSGQKQGGFQVEMGQIPGGIWTKYANEFWAEFSGWILSQN
jgi:hypothetical protein